MSGFEIIGTGRFVPGAPVTNADLAKVMDTSDEWVFQRSGIRQRHYAGEGQGASDLALEASRMAIADAGIDAHEIDYIIFSTMTPDYVFPGSAAVLGAKLGIHGVAALDIRQQCAAMIFGLQIMNGLFLSGGARTILFVGAEAHAGFMPWDDWDIVTGAAKRDVSPEARERANAHRALAVLFGDGAGAMIFRATARDAGLVKLKVSTDGRYAETLYVPGGGFRTRPYWKRDMFDEQAHIPRMDGRELFKFAVTKLPRTARELCVEAGVRIEEIDWFLAHQANQRINEYVREQLGVPREKMPMNIDRYGNTSAGTIPILVDEVRRKGKLRPGQLSMVLALGAGIHWGCALLRL
jgi:3-oxoacyl-[acyl-carrier-protein] synthase-3